MLVSSKDCVDKLERIHPFFNENIFIKCYQKNEIEFTIECYVGNTKLFEGKATQYSMIDCSSSDWCDHFEQIVKQLMNRPFEEVLDTYYEQDASMEELNEIAKLWNNTKNFREWVQAEREELGI